MTVKLVAPIGDHREKSKIDSSAGRCMPSSK
jgi:hypothetical protein